MHGQSHIVVTRDRFDRRKAGFQQQPHGRTLRRQFAGYGAAQAVPGPLFTFSAFLGTVNGSNPTGIAGAAVALVAIFLPAALLVIAAYGALSA